ncbi:DUF2004 domain-containing protein [Tritonibacter mobilis]|uniref:DUF2004 domain-containing protein n=1 Tax=Tritonibacter mobilis TaxID=379347 RepID=UPI00080681E8|nr:DUF2004 domain-containing protein [Tritonibacter mobilis]
MSNREQESSAREAIKLLIGRPEGDDSVNLFVEHHLSALEADYFSDAYGTPTPEPTKIVDSLVLVDSWSSEDGGSLDTFDFSLPENVTNYLLSVRFVDDEVQEISMES